MRLEAPPILLRQQMALLHPAPRARYPFRVPLWMILIAGYETLGRFFAYLLPPPIFIAELYIVGHLIQNRRNWIMGFVDDCLSGKFLPIAVLITMGWGVFEVMRSIYFAGPPGDTFRTSAFNYYAIMIPIGIMVGEEVSFQEFIKFWKAFLVFFSIYSIGFNTGGAFFDVVLPWKDDISLFNGTYPPLGALASVGTLALWPHLKNWNWKYVLLAPAMSTIFYAPGRSPFLGLIFGMAVILLYSPKLIVPIGGGIAAIFLLMTILTPFVPATEGRASTIDPLVNIARVRATFDPEGAYKMLNSHGLHEDAEKIISADGTARWREAIWTNAINSLNTTSLVLLGQGHGASVTDLTPDGQEIHTPHNFVIFALYYTGAIGLGIFCLLQLAIFLQCQRVVDVPLRTFLVSNIIMMIIAAAVGNMFETPFGAVPFYLLCGIGIGMDRTSRQSFAFSQTAPPF